jgi:hypothetical protein
MDALNSVIGKVSVLVGRASAVNADGVSRVLKLGDDIYACDVIKTAPEAKVEITFGPEHNFTVTENQAVTIDSTIYGDGDPEATRVAVLEREAHGFGADSQIETAIAGTGNLDKLLESTASGLGGGMGNEHGGRETLSALGRVSEDLSVEIIHNNPGLSHVASVAELSHTTTISAATATAFGVASLGSAQVIEGGNLVHNVVLNQTANGEQHLNFALNFESASAQDVGALQFSNGVTLHDGQLLIPTGVSAFSITLPALADRVHEGNETLSLTVGNASVQDTIVDNGIVPMQIGAQTLALHLPAADAATSTISHGSAGALQMHDLVSGPDALAHWLGAPAAPAAAANLHFAHLDLAAALAPAMHEMHVKSANE